MKCSNCEIIWLFCLANAIYDGDKESEGEEDGGSPEDSRKVSFVFFYSTHGRSDYISASTNDNCYSGFIC